MITERGRIIIAAFVILLCVAWITQVELVYFLTSMIGTILLLSLAIFLLTPFNIECKRFLPNSAYEDQTLSIKVSVENKGFFHNYFIYITDNFPADVSYRQTKELLFPFLARRKVSHKIYSGFCFKRGSYLIGPFTIMTSDPLGLFRKLKILDESSKLIVYPKIFNVANLTSFNRGIVTPRYGSRTSRRSGDYEEFFGIRPYQQEDGLRKIHWPSSAKRGQLIVRHFEQTGINTATIIIDLKWENNLGSGKETTLEYAVKIAASLSKYFLDQGYLIQVLAYGENPVLSSLGKDTSHFFTILDLLAQVESNSHYTLTETMNRLSYLIPPTSTLVVVRLDKDMETARALEQFMYSKNVSLVDIQLVASTFDANVPRTLPYLVEVRGSEIVTYTINCQDNLELKFIAT